MCLLRAIRRFVWLNPIIYPISYSMVTTKLTTSLTVRACTHLGASTYLLVLSSPDGQQLPPMYAGQFVQVLPPGGITLLRRPISICYVSPEGELWLLVARVGRGTMAITEVQAGDELEVILPLGNTFLIEGIHHPLLIGGGVGIAPMLMLASTFAEHGVRPDILLGGRTAGHIVLLREFERFGQVHITTEDGSLGVCGRVTDHPIFTASQHDRVYTCGPMPMMRAVAQVAMARTQSCQVSLENTMACGIGACLCCVQDTVSDGNQCVCTEGPVFDAREIKWR